MFCTVIALYEGLKVFREHLLIRAHQRQRPCPSEETTGVRQEKDGSVTFLHSDSFRTQLQTSDGYVIHI